MKALLMKLRKNKKVVAMRQENAFDQNEAEDDVTEKKKKKKKKTVKGGGGSGSWLHVVSKR